MQVAAQLLVLEHALDQTGDCRQLIHQATIEDPGDEGNRIVGKGHLGIGDETIGSVSTNGTGS